MAKNMQAIRGMNDYMPDETILWQRIEHSLKKVLRSYGYSEIRLPIVEQTSLFNRAIGTMTDVIEKEMYTFKDRNGNSLSLRPEGTAGCVRAGIEHGILYNQEQRLWYMGPMFRRERPQAGRYRQFHQLGCEVFGLQGPDIDAELILLGACCWRELGIEEHVSLELNSIGSLESRARYCKRLIDFLEQHQDQLDEDCRRRMYANPLRILDSKNKKIQMLIKDAPILMDDIDDESRQHFEQLVTFLTQVNVPFTVNPNLVRGLNYYTRTVFEWVTTCLGSKGSVCAGGRYDGMVEQLGGHETPAVGFAMGLERLALLVQSVNPNLTVLPCVDVYLISSGVGTQLAAIKLAEMLRGTLPKLKLMTHCGGGNFKKQFARANKWSARIALLLGEKEVASDQIIIKNLKNGEQDILNQIDLPTRLATLLY